MIVCVHGYNLLVNVAQNAIIIATIEFATIGIRIISAVFGTIVSPPNINLQTNTAMYMTINNTSEIDKYFFIIFKFKKAVQPVSRNKKFLSSF